MRNGPQYRYASTIQKYSRGPKVTKRQTSTRSNPGPGVTYTGAAKVHKGYKCKGTNYQNTRYTISTKQRKAASLWMPGAQHNPCRSQLRKIRHFLRLARTGSYIKRLQKSSMSIKNKGYLVGIIGRPSSERININRRRMMMLTVQGYHRKLNLTVKRDRGELK